MRIIQVQHIYVFCVFVIFLIFQVGPFSEFRLSSEKLWNELGCVDFLYFCQVIIWETDLLIICTSFSPRRTTDRWGPKLILDKL